MATQVDIPVTDDTVNLTDPADVGMSFLMLIVGFVILFTSAGLGQEYASKVQGYLGSILPGSDSGNDIQVV